MSLSSIVCLFLLTRAVNLSIMGAKRLWKPASWRKFTTIVAKEVVELNTYVLEYQYVPNILERRAPFRGRHLEYTVSFVDNKTLIAGGALVPTNEPITRGNLLFRAPNAKVVEDFAKSDPYVLGGLITSWKVTEWKVVVGDDMFGKMWNK